MLYLFATFRTDGIADMIPEGGVELGVITLSDSFCQPLPSANILSHSKTQNTSKRPEKERQNERIHLL